MFSIIIIMQCTRKCNLLQITKTYSAANQNRILILSFAVANNFLIREATGATIAPMRSHELALVWRLFPHPAPIEGLAYMT